MNTKRKRIKGFSLGETLLSIAVLVSGILPIFLALSKGYETSVNSRNLTIASGLAQEGVELVQNVRNNAALDSGTSSFEEWLPASAGSGVGIFENCRIDPNDTVLEDYTVRVSCQNGSYRYDLTVGGDGLLSHNDSEGFFKRRIFLDYDEVAETLDMVSAVYWGETEPGAFAGVRNDCTSANRCVYAETQLSPWR